MIISRSIHVAANGIISFFLWLSNIPLYICATSSWVLLSSLLFRIFCVFSHSVISDPLWPHGLQHTKLPCPSQSSGVCSDSCPLNQWYHCALPYFFIVVFLVDYEHIFREQFCFFFFNCSGYYFSYCLFLFLYLILYPTFIFGFTFSFTYVHLHFIR